MRKVKIVSTMDIPKMFTTSSDLEESLNSIFEEIKEIRGDIIKTEYGISHSGHLETVIVEYEVP